MVVPVRQGVKAIALALLALACGSTIARLRTHADVMVAEAHKGNDLVRAGRFSAETMPELTYPLERATAVSRQLHARGDAAPNVLAAFDALIERYRAFVDALDRVRREQRGEAAAAALASPLAAVDQAAEALRTAIDRPADQ